jgi:hypothetical protein
VACLERALADYEALKMVHLHSIAIAQLAESYLSAGRAGARAHANTSRSPRRCTARWPCPSGSCSRRP